MPFQATLVWSDPPAQLSSSWLLINDLDLSLSTSASPRLYLGNDWHTNSTPLYDVTNNAERIRLPPPPTSTLVSVHVRGSHVPVDGQQYALVVTGHFVVREAKLCAGVHVCPQGCGGNGECGVDGVCACREGWTGEDCRTTSVALEGCGVVAGRVEFGSWRFYHIDPRVTAALPATQWKAIVQVSYTTPTLLHHHHRLSHMIHHLRTHRR